MHFFHRSKMMQFPPSMSVSALFCRGKIIFSIIYSVLYWLVREILLKIKVWKLRFHTFIERGPHSKYKEIQFKLLERKLPNLSKKATSRELWNQFNYIFLLDKTDLTNHYKTEYITENIILTLQSNTLADILGGNCIFF